MITDLRLNQLKSEAEGCHSSAQISEDKAQEKLFYFHKGHYAFTKTELYALLDKMPNSLLVITIPFTKSDQVVGFAGFKRLQFISYGGKFLGEEWIKKDNEFDLFANDERKGQEFVFVKDLPSEIIRKECLKNVMNLLDKSNKYLDQCETVISAYIMGRILNKFENEANNESERYN